MKRYFLLILVLIATLVVSVSPVGAQGPTIYVDPYRSAGNEDGSKTNPYNKQKEGEAYLQSLPYGGDLYIRDKNGNWGNPIQVDPANPGIPGTPLPRNVLFAILAILALAMIVAGWYLQRRSHRMGR